MGKKSFIFRLYVVLVLVNPTLKYKRCFIPVKSDGKNINIAYANLIKNKEMLYYEAHNI